MKLEGIDLLAPRLYLEGRAHTAWRILRERAPVFWNRGRRSPGFWAITRHADISAISRDPARYSSAGGTSIDLPPGYRPAERAMAVVDPPEHGRLRGIVARAFSPALVRSLEPKLRASARELATRAVAAGGCEFVTEIAEPLGLLALGSLIGIPEDDRPRFARLSRKTFFRGAPTDDQLATLRQRRRDLMTFLIELVFERRGPGDDLISKILAGGETQSLTHEQVMRVVTLLVRAGRDTTRHAMTGGMLALIEHPEQFARLKRAVASADADALSRAVEEVLRWAPPINHFARTVTQPTELRGTTLARGDRVVMFYPSANRDAEVFGDPDRFDLDRSPNPHLSLGTGQHACLGVALARLQLSLFAEEIALRLRPARLVRPPERIATRFLAGYRSLELALPPR